jgi:nitroreductase
MLNDRSTLMSALATRRSGKPRDLGTPGPSPDQLREMLAVAARTPDHGKLAPWRFVTVAPERRDAFARLLREARLAEPPEPRGAELDKLDEFARQAPALVVVLSSPREGGIPLWEQEMSAGAAIMNLLHGANAMGFAGGWLTGWPSTSAAVRDAFGAAPERIVGFVFIGTPTRPLEERPRPELDQVVSSW